jgi:hypothetical protein
MSSIVIQLLNGLASASTLFLVAAGLSLIFGVTRIVNFAHGSLYMLGIYAAYSFIAAFGVTPLGFWGGVIAAALAVGVFGALVEIALLRRIYRAPELFQLLATFALTLVVKDFAVALGAEDAGSPARPGGAVDIAGFVPRIRSRPDRDRPLVLGRCGSLLRHALEQAVQWRRRTAAWSRPWRQPEMALHRRACARPALAGARSRSRASAHLARHQRDLDASWWWSSAARGPRRVPRRPHDRGSRRWRRRRPVKLTWSSSSSSWRSCSPAPGCWEAWETLRSAEEVEPALHPYGRGMKTATIIAMPPLAAPP